MSRNGRKIVIIGSGIAGLSAAVYALKCGYEVEILEMHNMAGGLATSWKRGEYTFEGCLHWLVGSKPGADFHSLWTELLDMSKLSFVDPEEFVRIEDEDGNGLSIFTDVDRLQAELLRIAPKDANAIYDLTHSIRSLSKLRMIDPAGNIVENGLNIIRDLPILPVLNKLSKISGAEYGARFSDTRLRAFFTGGDIGKMSAIAIIISLGWMHARNAGYCIGGSQALIRLIEETIQRLGGTIRFNSKVDRILVQEDKAIGVELQDGETVMADWIISAADGHSTIFEMLGGKFADDALRARYQQKEPFASYLQVSLGVARDLRDQPAMVRSLLKSPIEVDPGTELSYIQHRIFHFDPTFSPPDKTAITSILPTRNYEYWKLLRENDVLKYREEKQRVAEAVISILEKRIPKLSADIEVIDVTTPASIIRYTGNWKGSMEGWLIEPGAGFKPLPNTLPGLNRFLMVGQWIMPGGGLPSGPLTARPAIKAICKQDHVPFSITVEHAPKCEEIAV
jgi:phytoene dehydrogenase-like protein